MREPLMSVSRRGLDHRRRFDGRRGHRLPAVGIACLLAFTTNACLLGLGSGGLVDRMADLRSRAERFVNSISSEDYDGAYSLMSEAYHSAVSLDRFRAGVRNNPYLRRGRAVHVHELIELDGTATLTGVIDAEPGEVTVVFSFSGDAEQLSIAGVTIGGMPAVPGFDTD